MDTLPTTIKGTNYLQGSYSCDCSYFIIFAFRFFYTFSLLLQVLNSKFLKAKDRNTKRDIRKELKTLAKEERKRQQLAVTDVLKNADVVLTTLTGASSKKLNGITFDLVVIDEAAQALEIACWIALLKVSIRLKDKSKFMI